MMQRLVVSTLAIPALMALLTTAAPARALVAAPPSLAARVAAADTIVLGRVVGVEDKDVSLKPYPGAANTVPYRVAIVAVADSLKGGKGLKMIRVGFTAPPTPANPNVPIRPIIRPGIRVNLKNGQEGLFYLTKHFEGKLHLMPMYYDFTAKDGNPNFNKDLEEVRGYGRLLENPLEGLKNKDPEKRFQTAAMLVTAYRTSRGGPVKTEPISAEESKLILTALAEANWTQQPGRFNALHPMNVFNQLRVTAKDGYQPPKRVTNIQDLYNAARTWLRNNASTYRIQRFVPAATAAER